MAVFKVVRFPDPVLLKRTERVESFGERERILVRDMIDTMYAQKGVGLAANQIGVSRHIFVASADGVRGKELVFYNSRIIKCSGRTKDQEGCLSIPGYYEDVKRYSKVTLRGQVPDGRTVEVEAEGLLARIFQHETDHLEGMLYIHRLSFLKKRRALKHCAVGEAG